MKCLRVLDDTVPSVTFVNLVPYVWVRFVMKLILIFSVSRIVKSSRESAWVVVAISLATHPVHF